MLWERKLCRVRAKTLWGRVTVCRVVRKGLLEVKVEQSCEGSKGLGAVASGVRALQADAKALRWVCVRTPVSPEWSK